MPHLLTHGTRDRHLYVVLALLLAALLILLQGDTVVVPALAD